MLTYNIEYVIVSITDMSCVHTLIADIFFVLLNGTFD